MIFFSSLQEFYILKARAKIALMSVFQQVGENEFMAFAEYYCDWLETFLEKPCLAKEWDIEYAPIDSTYMFEIKNESITLAFHNFHSSPGSVTNESPGTHGIRF